jgi:hypothetical protein
MRTFGETSRSKVGQASSGDAEQIMDIGPSSKESATREFADLDIPRPSSHISSGCSFSLQR